MSRLARTQLKKQQKREFNKQFIKKYSLLIIILACLALMLLGCMKAVSVAVRQHESKVELIRKGQYIDPDFQDSWKTKEDK